MEKINWEYKIINFSEIECNSIMKFDGESIHPKNLESKLNSLGYLGWEVVGCLGSSSIGRIILKRPK